MRYSIINGDRSLSEWLAERIIIDVRDKYGIEIEIACVSVCKPAEEITASRQGSTSLPVYDAPTERSDAQADVLTVQDVQRILGIGRRQAYEMMENPPFPVKKLGKRGLIRIPKEPFLKWLNGRFVQ